MPDSAPSPELQIGLNVDVVAKIDFDRERIDVRRSKVFDIEQGEVILSQTDPALNKSFVGRTLRLTFIHGKDLDRKRYGVQAKILRLVNDYQLSRNEKTRAIVVEPRSKFTPSNVRMFYRVRPRKDAGLALTALSSNANIIDISLGGAKFTLPRDPRLVLGKALHLELEVDEQSFSVKSNIVRTDTVKGRMADKLQTVSVQFLDIDKSGELALGRKIQAIQREERQAELELELDQRMTA